jgi:O-antigen ligase
VSLEILNRASKAGLLALPGVLTVYFGFNAGGFFPNTSAFVAAVLAAFLALRVMVADDPFDGFSRPLALVAGALFLYAVWTFMSAIWSDSLGRSLLELNRILLYLFAVLLFGSVARTSECMRWMVRGLALGILIVCVAGLITRVLPDVWTISPNISTTRLSYPLTYWNALGILASLGIVFCFHLTCSLGEPRVVRVLAAGAVPALAATLLLTFSRGAIGAGIVGLLSYAILARPRGLLTGLLAAGPPTAIAVLVAYNADKLATGDASSPAGVAEGHDVAVAVALCAVAAILVRSILIVGDRSLARASFRFFRPVLFASVIAGVIALFALDAPGEVERQYDRFVEGNRLEASSDLRTRLTDPGNNGRLDQWKAALDGFEQAPVGGQGAGTYRLVWERERPNPTAVTDAHSLYVEVLGELGVVGLVLLVFAIVMIVGTTAARSRRRNRTVYGAVVAASIAWALHAGLDWDWEMPAVTIWLFALGGGALARNLRGTPNSLPHTLPVRAGAASCCLILAVVPALVFVSQARLDESLDAYKHGDCGKAVDAARSSSSALEARPEPYEIVAYCELNAGNVDRALGEIEKAVERDPDNWMYRYELALTRGAAGLDPRPQARLALELNRFAPEAGRAVERFRSRDRRVWRRQARSLLTGALPFYLSSR